MISRIWHGWTTHENADSYEETVTKEVIPGIFSMQIPGFEKIELYRRQREHDVEFITIMWFRDLDAVRAFVGEDYETAHVPAQARKVLSHFDERSQHYSVLLSREAS